MNAVAKSDYDGGSPHHIFRFVSDSCCTAVVKRVLSRRDTVAEDVQKRLAARLRKLHVDGFKHADRAPPHKLLNPVVEEIGLGDDRLARAVLEAWMETRPELREATAAYLESAGIPVPKFAGVWFDAHWTTGEWLGERDAMTAKCDPEDADEAALMLCLVSRRFPAPPRLESPIFAAWCDLLWELPPDAPEWEEASAFEKWVHEIRESKRSELFVWQTFEIDATVDVLADRFDDEMGYLEIDPTPWPLVVEERPALAEQAIVLLRALRTSLKEYQPVHPQAVSRSEEIARVEERREIEAEILGIMEAWREVVSRPDPPEPAEAEMVDLEAAQGADGPAGGDGAEPIADYERLERERLSREKAIDHLEEANRELAAAQAKLMQDIGSLKDELSWRRKREMHWRAAYVHEKQSREPEDEPVLLESVVDAMALAQERFPNTLLLKLNSKSSKDTPFESAREVYAALEWLATEYHRNVPPDSITKACPGWFYKPNQSEATIGRFPEWYQTQVNGMTWKLSKHIGRGVSHDPRHTIRIAFEWDEPNDRVIVGFLGLHQRTLNS